ncbi:MAG: carboxymuconolactone decarboxylase family protein, partial [Burkholderiales bacterium]
AGIADAKMDAVRHWRAMSPDAAPTGATAGVIFSDDEELVLELADAMTRDIEVPDGLMERLRARFDARGVVEVVATVAAYNMVSRFLVALRIEH